MNPNAPKILIISSNTDGGHPSAAAAIVAGIEGFGKGSASDDVTLYLVGTADARRQLVDYGIAPERVKVSGLPVHPKFDFPGEHAAQAARRALGLETEKFTVFLNAGWEGGGNISQIFRELVRGELDVQAIFLAGKNEALRSEAE